MDMCTPVTPCVVVELGQKDKLILGALQEFVEKLDGMTHLEVEDIADYYVAVSLVNDPGTLYR